MIVQCDKCQTKFRIADDKVTDNGVKVRCSKCAHVFVVRKDLEVAAPPELMRLDRSATVKVKPETLASIAAGSQRVASGPGRAPTIPTQTSSAVTSRIPAAATTREAVAALGFGSAPPKGLPPVPAFPTNVGPSPLPAFPDSTRRDLPTFPAEGRASTVSDRFPEARSEATTEQLRLPSTDPLGAPIETDPFAPFGSRPGEVFSKIPSAAGGNPFAPGVDPFGALNPAAPDPFPKMGSSPDYPPYNDPFAKIGSSPGANFPPAFGTDPFAHSPRQPDPFSDNPLNQPIGRKESNPFQNPPSPGPDLHQHGPKSEPKSTIFPAPMPVDKPLTQVGMVVPPAATSDDPFAELDNEPSAAFEAPDSMPMTKLHPHEEERPRPMARIPLGRAGLPSGEMGYGQTTAIAHAYRALDRGEERRGPLGAWPTLLGSVLGLLVVLFVFPGLGRQWIDLGLAVDLFDLKPKKLLPESIDDVTPEGAAVTSYEGKAGKWMLVVSGTAHNSGKERREHVQAVVLMMDGTEIVERRRALVGLPVDEAAIASVGNAAELDALYQTARASANADQLGIDPGANVRFVVVFPEIPAKLEERKFRVEFVEAPTDEARAETAPKKASDTR